MSDTHPGNESADGAEDARRALQAVQFALDRRDNGGDAGAARVPGPLADNSGGDSGRERRHAASVR